MKIFCYTKDAKVARRSLNSIPEKLACISQNIRVEIIAMRLFFFTMAGIAQSVQRLTAEWEVGGSIRGAGAILGVLK